MKISGYKFGHPVFGLDDYFDFKPELNIESSVVNNNLEILSSVFDLGDNEELKQLITDNKAVVLVEISCSYTMYRKVFIFNTENIDINIPLESIKNKVEVLYLIVAKESFENYTNESIKDDLQEQSFYIEEGDILAFLGEEIITLDVSTSMDSIVKLRESTEKEKHTFTWNEDSIIINLSTDEFSKLKRLKDSLDYQKILVSSILQPALIHACYKLEDENYSEKNWHKALLIHWDKYRPDNEFAPSSEDIPDFIELLLHNPFNLVIETINNIDERENNL
jgi:hypothetical protein